MHSIIDFISNLLLDIFKLPEIVTVLISMLPIVEARLGIPMAIGYGLNPFTAFLLGFIGSSIVVPILLLILLPIINFLRKTKLFKKIGDVIYEKFESRSKKVDADTHDSTNPKRDFKIMLGVFLFVAIPMPLTGVWTGSAIASICGLKYHKSVIAVVLGNLCASVIITLLSVFFKEYINTIILVIGLIAIGVVVSLILKIIFSKPKQSNDENICNEKQEPSQDDAP